MRLEAAQQDVMDMATNMSASCTANTYKECIVEVVFQVLMVMKFVCIHQPS